VVEDDADSYSFQFELAIEARRDPTLRRPVADLYELYHDAIGRELTRLGLGADPALAQMVLATLEGLIFQQIVGVSPRQDVEQALARLRQTLATLAGRE